MSKILDSIKYGAAGGGGSTPTGSVTLTANGTYDVTDKATAIVNVPDTSLPFLQRTLTTYSNSEITSIGDFAFSGCDDLVSVDLPNATAIGASTFNKCSKLASVNIPKVTAIPTAAFNSTPSLTAFDFSNVTEISGTAFNNSGLTGKIVIPHVTELAGMAFGNCENLTVVDLKAVQTFTGTNVFYNCNNLVHLILRYEGGVVPLPAAVKNFFGSNSKMAKLNGYVFVPSALVSQYQAATNWSTIGGYILPIEGSQYEE